MRFNGKSEYVETNNNQIAHTTAHEVGHQLDFIYGKGKMYSYEKEGGLFPTALNNDLTFMRCLPACGYDASDRQIINPQTQQFDGDQGYYAWSNSSPLKTAFGSTDTVTAAVKFYDSGQYEQARQLLEQSMQSGRYDAHVCYYAALANRKCGAESRAGKLFEYVVQNFPDSNEAKLFQQANPATATRRVSLVASSVIKGKTEIGQHPFTAADIAKDG